MSLYSDPPPLLPFFEVKPTLLVCWWITIFCTTIILFRVGGRYVRTERLFPEDKTAALSMVPLFLRMGCVHVILTYGTNNADFSGVDLTDEQLRQKSIASGLVLASRILHAATYVASRSPCLRSCATEDGGRGWPKPHANFRDPFFSLWILKNASLDFFKRLIGGTWTKSYTRMLLYIRITLVATFAAIIISDLAECQPFDHYWQVLPDPGGRCRQGYAQLLTMAICNIFTDLLLVFFPIPIILRSAMTVKRKVQLVSLFSLSLAVVATTLYRVPHVIEANGSQQLRSLLASVELLFATSTANALVLGSFVRDRGVKKRKFKLGSVADGMGPAGGHGPPQSSASRRPTLHRHWGSDEDLVRDLGLGLDVSLRTESPDTDEELAIRRQRKFTPAPPVAPDMSHWRFPSNRHSGGSGSSTQKRASLADTSDASLLSRDQHTNPPSPGASRSNSTTSPRKVSFFDVGGLLDDGGAAGTGRMRRDSYNSSVDPLSPVGTYGPLNNGPAPSPALPASNSGFRRGSTALIHDLGGLLPLGQSRQHRSARSSRSAGTELQTIPQGRPGGIPDLVDAGGLLHRH
ncbi:hypothetical protein MKZ38_005535 [Zalerion maritima]|uniref:Rhodopsin domain-containing protein n=1 Tax=Zalerion maritima TaxID=339359 RepID=A0AAD5WUS8_9PEZI|nr:hypothetical protein MKZ38_005535 [Zalerion maritima]